MTTTETAPSGSTSDFDPTAVREDVRAWLAENWRPGGPEAEWRSALVESGWAAPTWPVEWYGRGLPPDSRAIVAEEFERVGATGGGQDLTIYGNVLLAYGSEDLRKRFLRPLMLGEIRACLLYSEPGAGSDLAAVQTRAERRGDSWVVNGQKVWTSGALQADYAVLLSRTDMDQPKHRGMTYFWFPMKQPGVEVRPIRQVTGGASFNEVFFNDAQVPEENRLGEVNAGWGVLQTALGFERLLMGSTVRPDTRPESELTPDEVKARRESPARRVVGGADYVALARTMGKNTDPLVRQSVARIYTYEQVNHWNSLRARVEAGTGGQSSIASLGKLAMSRILHYGVRVTTDILGAESVLDFDASPVAGEVNRSGLAAYMTSIGGGSDQVQRNIIGERLLGLPKEPELDKTIPFREVPKAQAIRKFS